ncbi:GNAT family N-acetyltransferase [Cohnella ginsengisoli]|uniref:GNAT family N-acetyltransferase n=1 Tax=Cohnella ginsengisoli TaxID=425004 RepID=A0A9X4KMP5_9BACL|nr:GNAT family N-acetyltransferase [Cohnella ginsengisoli]MDG0794963.1 GNAT family N-acetyltransferase [Cohnella ginsengisoli]
MKPLMIEEMKSALPGVYERFVPPELRHALQRIPASFLILGVRRGGEPVGLAIAERRAAGAAGLLALTVAEHERRQGIGRILYGETEAILRQTGTQLVGADFLGGIDPDTSEAAFFEGLRIR